MRHLVAWLSSIDPTSLSAWATVVSAVSSIALLVATVWLGRLTRVLATETKLTRLANERAQVDCSIQPSPDSISLQNLVVLNSSKNLAQDVTIKVMRGGHFYRSLNPVFQFTNFIPGERKEIFIGSYIQMTEKIFEANVSYRDKTGYNEFTYKQDLSLWNDLTQVGEDPQVGMIKKLDEIKRTLDGWTSSGRLRVTTYTKRESEEEQAQWFAAQDAAARLQQGVKVAPTDQNDGEPS